MTQEQIGQTAEAELLRVMSEYPDSWYAVVQYMSLLASAERHNYTPMGLVPEGREMIKRAMKRRD